MTPSARIFSPSRGLMRGGGCELSYIIPEQSIPHYDQVLLPRLVPGGLLRTSLKKTCEHRTTAGRARYQARLGGTSYAAAEGVLKGGVVEEEQAGERNGAVRRHGAQTAITCREGIEDG